MLLNNILLTFYRVTVRHPLYAALNLLGLSFGIAVFVILSLYARFETGFETWLPDAAELYQVHTRWTLPGRPEALDRTVMGGLIDQLHEDYPDLLGTRVWDNQVSVAFESDVAHENEDLVDPDFFKLFDLPFLAGDKAGALASPDKVVLTEEMARKYFGRADAVGETIRLTDLQGVHPYTVSGVLKSLPRNTDFSFGFIRLMTPEAAATQPHWRHWGSTQVLTFLRFQTPAQADGLAAQMDAFIDRRADEPPPGGQHTLESLRFVPLTRAHLLNAGSESAIVTLGLVGLAAFLIAAINFINLSTARAGIRAREVAVRRTLGATRAALRIQFLGEAALMTLIASLAGLAIVELTLPLINAAGGLALSLDYRHQGLFLLALMAGVLALGLLSGVYPAFVLSGFQPAQVLASSRSPSGGRFGLRVREVLVVVQFAVVIAFFILTWGFDRQMDHMRTADLGFRRDGLLIVSSTYDSAVTPALLHSIMSAFRTVPGVTLVSSSNSAPGDEHMRNFTSIDLPGGTGHDTNVMEVQVGPDFFQAYGAHLLAGRLFDPAHPADESPTKLDPAVPWPIVVSDRLLPVFGFATPQAAVDQTLHMGRYSLHIIGIVDELRFHSQKEKLPPAIYYFHADSVQDQIAAIRYEGVSEPEMRTRLTAVWRTVAPDIPLDIISAQDNLARYYEPDRNRSRLFDIAAAVAALVGCIGLYGMAAFTASRRMLEVAVRKVLGASRRMLVSLLVGSFLRPVLLANLIAAPVAYILLRNWLVQFNDRIAMTPVPFLIGGGAAILVAATTVGMLAWNAANSEPGRALRHE